MSRKIKSSISEYSYLIVESFIPDNMNGKHGLVHIRPAFDQDDFLTTMMMECSKELSDTSKYPLGTKFKIKGKVISRKNGTLFVYSRYSWEYKLVK